jgi:hypothetical protein
VLGTSRVNVFNVESSTKRTEERSRSRAPVSPWTSRDFRSAPGCRRRRGGTAYRTDFIASRDRVTVNAEPDSPPARRAALRLRRVREPQVAGCGCPSDGHGGAAADRGVRARSTAGPPARTDPAIKLDPKNARTTTPSGRCACTTRTTRGRAETSRLKLDPAYAEGHNSLGLIYLSQGKLPRPPPSSARRWKTFVLDAGMPPTTWARRLPAEGFPCGRGLSALWRSSRTIPRAVRTGMLHAARAACRRRKSLHDGPAVAPRRRSHPVRVGHGALQLGRRSEAVVQFRRVAELDPAGDLGSSRAPT